MSDGILVYVKKGDYAIIKTSAGFVLSVLIPNFFENSHIDVSKDFLMDLGDLVERRKFEDISLLAKDIRGNYESYISREIGQVNIVGRDLIV